MRKGDERFPGQTAHQPTLSTHEDDTQIHWKNRSAPARHCRSPEVGSDRAINDAHANDALGSLSLSSSCTAASTPVPSHGQALFGQLVRAWSMEGFLPSPARSQVSADY
jgi:hypothetical protein